MREVYFKKTFAFLRPDGLDVGEDTIANLMGPFLHHLDIEHPCQFVAQNANFGCAAFPSRTETGVTPMILAKSKKFIPISLRRKQISLPVRRAFFFTRAFASTNGCVQRPSVLVGPVLLQKSSLQTSFIPMACIIYYW